MKSLKKSLKKSTFRSRKKKLKGGRNNDLVEKLLEAQNGIEELFKACYSLNNNNDPKRAVKQALEGPGQAPSVEEQDVEEPGFVNTIKKTISKVKGKLSDGRKGKRSVKTKGSGPILGIEWPEETSIYEINI